MSLRPSSVRQVYKKRLTWFALTVLIATLTACPATQPVPDPAQGPTGRDLDGQGFDWLAELDRDEYTLVVFMTLWCDVCEREEPEVEAWARRNSSVAQTFLVVSGSDLADVQGMVTDRGVQTETLRVVVDSDGAVAARYDVTGTPTLLLFEPGGQLVATYWNIPEVPDVSATSEQRVPFMDTGHELGTSYDVVVYAEASRAEEVNLALQSSRTLCRELDAVLSEWRDDSEVNRVNRTAADGPVFVSETLYRLLEGAVHVSEVTDGAFDITWRPYDSVWQLAVHRGEIPLPEELSEAAPSVGYELLSLEGGAVHFLDPNVEFGVAGVAKGWIIDAVFRHLVEFGFEHIVVNIGGDLRTAGRDELGQRHTFWIADPFIPDASAGFLTVEDTAMATSGNYVRYREIGGRRFGHILDPRTGWPPTFTGSVTVLTRDAAMADALATALFVLGPDTGLSLAQSVDGLDAVYVTATGVMSTLNTDALHTEGRRLP